MCVNWILCIDLLKDVEKGSTFSGDSGAVLDVGESKDRHFGKSQSIPDTRRAGLSSGITEVSAGKKGDFGDSGLCLLADTTSSTLMAPPPVPSKEKVLHWISNNDKWQEGDRDPSTNKHRLVFSYLLHRYARLLFIAHYLFQPVRSRPPSSTSPISSRRSRKQVTTYATSRSESLERGGAGPSAQHDLNLDDMSRNRPPTKPK